MPDSKLSQPSKFSKMLGFNPSTKSNQLYALCDYETLLKKNLNLDDFLEQITTYNTKILQFRDKISCLSTKQKNLEYLKSKLDIPIIINDELSLVQIADGVHLGQEDFLKIASSKKEALEKIIETIGEDKLIGLSTHNLEEIIEANSLNIDMIGLGAYKATSTKDVPNLLGNSIETLAKSSVHPVCAIGGVNINDKIKNVSFNVVGSGLYA